LGRGAHYLQEDHPEAIGARASALVNRLRNADRARAAILPLQEVSSPMRVAPMETSILGLSLKELLRLDNMWDGQDLNLGPQRIPRPL